MSEPSHLRLSTVSRLLEASAVVICAVWGRVPRLPVLTSLLRGFRFHLTMFTENYFVHRVFQARTLQQPCVAAVCVNCHTVRTNLFRVPCGCFTCEKFLSPWVTCPQRPVC